MRKLATAAAVSLVLSSGAVRALGLGDIEMRSALNQPMNAEIRLTSVQPGEASGMIVKLASPDAFSRAGIERTNALTDLRFSVDDSAGVPVIRISSSRPVVEPFLNFLVEVDWPTGRMVREYTVLLDPPVFMTPSASDRNSASEQPATLQRNEASLNTPTPIERSTDDFDVEIVGTSVEIGDSTESAGDGGEVVSLDGLGGGLSGNVGSVELIDDNAQGDVVALTDSSVANTEAAAQFQADQNFEFDVEIVGSTSEVSDTFVVGGEEVSGSEVVSLDSLESDEAGSSVTGGGGEVTVQRGDTLGSIAEQVAVPGVSPQQMMMALLSANKNAFINGNVNLVKAGAILRIPEGDELIQLTQAQAVAQIGEQNQLWREYRDNIRSSRGTQVAAAPPTPTPEPESQPVEDAQAEQATEQPTELSEAAQRILDAAKDEAAGENARKELNIVADSDSTTTSASATADNSEASEAALLGEINKKLTLAKEELASTRLESVDLTEQSDELGSTTENMESLVSIRQTEVARLEEALKEATAQAEAEKLAAAEAEAAAKAQAEQEAIAQAEAEKAALAEAEAAAEAEAEAAAEAEKLAQAEAEAESAALAEAESTAAAEAEQATVDTDATGETTTDAEGVVAEADAEPETNALTAAGETLESVELVEDTEAQTAIETATATTDSAQAGYMGLLQKYGKWIVAGIGGLSALILGILLLGKRRRNAADEMLDYGDEVEFLDDEEDGIQLQAEAESEAASSDIDPAVIAGAAGVAGAATAGVADAEMDAPSMEEDPASLTAQMDVMDNTTGPDGLDPDDTISEVDVYLAYGLHGQAEELLSKAIDRDPTNHEYALKLLQTQHAQGNADAFALGATKYHENYGGDKAPNWDSICNMGHDLQPNNDLFASSAVAVESIGKSNDGSETMDVDDFATDESSTTGSISRDFSDSTEAASDVDEADLMDQSLDPAFAFDETDLEATGDFSQMADDIVAEEEALTAESDTLVELADEIPDDDDNSLDFPGFDAADSVTDIAEASKDKLSSVDTVLKTGVGGAAAAAAGGLAATAAAAKDSASDVFDDALSLDDLDSAASAANDGAQGSVAEDLTLDLEQLSGDIGLESTDLLDQTSATGLDDLEISDLATDNELLSDNVASIDGSDEMDTMMDLAKAYIDMGDKDSASSALGEIVKSGNPAQVSEAETLLRKIS